MIDALLSRWHRRLEVRRLLRGVRKAEGWSDHRFVDPFAAHVLTHHAPYDWARNGDL